MVAAQTAATKDELSELALGVDSELFIGVPGESEIERAARMDAAADIVADLRRADPLLAAYAERLLSMAPVPLRRPAMIRRTAHVGRVAA
ncbi:hypothetical protein ACFC1T_00290 [Kitasatospora sp. NPDC056076]|uniref:hypothetical protein n=1 Tax=Kitasatospora sp. NPDC056076 TaxID=3345703 RepID=UPI0035DE8391